MRIVINAQLDPQNSGGITQVLIALAYGLARLDGPDEYYFVCTPSSAERLKPYASGGVRLIVNERRTAGPRLGPRESDGFFESFAPDVLHFPYQSYTRTRIPTVFNPHDLQHVHLPELFTEHERTRREALYGPACMEADAVVVASEWVRRDVVAHYGIDAGKVHVIEWGAPTAAYQKPDETEMRAIRDRLDLPPRFALYPAQTWPHKNHARLFDALALLRDRHGIRIPLVCTGALTEHAAALRDQAARLSLTNDVRFLGLVEPQELLALYHSARFVVIPTLFEAVSFPIYEAFATGAPVACSNVTSLPEQVGDAAVIFDPYNVEDMARAMHRLYVDDALRRNLAERGAQRIAGLTLKRMAEAYRAVYHAVAIDRHQRENVSDRQSLLLATDS